MVAVEYPIECYNDKGLDPIQDKIFDWLKHSIKVHFLFKQHQNNCIAPSFNLVSNGDHPSMKIIYITPNLEHDVITLVEVFNLNYWPPNYPHKGDEVDPETPPSNRRFPL